MLTINNLSFSPVSFFDQDDIKGWSHSSSILSFNGSRATNRELRFVLRSPERIMRAKEGVVGAEVEVVTCLCTLLLLGYGRQNLKQNISLLKITLKIQPIQAYDHQYKSWHQLWDLKPQEYCPLMSRTPLERSRSRQAAWAFHISYRQLAEELPNDLNVDIGHQIFVDWCVLLRWPILYSVGSIEGQEMSDI